MKFKRWTHHEGGSKRWSAHLAIWRCQFSVTLMKHVGCLPPRWVIQTSTTYDQK